LITVVLALQVANSRGEELAFLPGLAFAAILATNLLVIVGSIRARRAPAQAAPAEGQQPVAVEAGPTPDAGA
jgi:Na+(H+)/acetate symporter ActP